MASPSAPSPPGAVEGTQSSGSAAVAGESASTVQSIQSSAGSSGQSEVGPRCAERGGGGQRRRERQRRRHGVGADGIGGSVVERERNLDRLGGQQARSRDVDTSVGHHRHAVRGQGLPDRRVHHGRAHKMELGRLIAVALLGDRVADRGGASRSRVATGAACRRTAPARKRSGRRRCSTAQRTARPPRSPRFLRPPRRRPCSLAMASTRKLPGDRRRRRRSRCRWRRSARSQSSASRPARPSRAVRS